LVADFSLDGVGPLLGLVQHHIPEADCEPPLTIIRDGIDPRQVAEALIASATTLKRRPQAISAGHNAGSASKVDGQRVAGQVAAGR
jgi:hypothetical protein